MKVTYAQILKTVKCAAALRGAGRLTKAYGHLFGPGARQHRVTSALTNLARQAKDPDHLEQLILQAYPEQQKVVTPRLVNLVSRMHRFG